MEHILVLDVPGIKEYVFGTERLVEIRGASALLDHLNREETQSFLKKKLGKENVDCIFAGGGAAQFIIRADENELQAAVDGLKGYFHSESQGGLRLISGHAELKTGAYQECLSRAFMQLNLEKDELPFEPCSTIHTGFLRECESCSSPASEIDNYADSLQILCNVCHGKVEHEQKMPGLWKGFVEHLKSRGIANARRAKDFGDIGEASSKNGQLALVYADGNAMGRIVKSIDSPESFSFFSKTVDESIRAACHEALYDCCICKGGAADILLLGGDDLLVCMSADAAIPFAIAVAQKFEEMTKIRFAKEASKAPAALKERGVSISTGIVFAKSHTPFSLLLEQAEELLKSAKKGGSACSNGNKFSPPSYLDFHFFSKLNQIKVADSRRKHLQLNDIDITAEPALKRCITLHQKPYALNDAQRLYDLAARILESGIPRSRFNRLGQAPFLGRMNGTLECLQLVGRARKEHKELLWKALDDFGCGENIPWRKDKNGYSTMLVDLVELAGFISSKGKEDNEDA